MYTLENNYGICFFVLGGQHVFIINIELPLFCVYPSKIYGTTNSSYLIQNWSDEKSPIFRLIK